MHGDIQVKKITEMMVHVHNYKKQQQQKTDISAKLRSQQNYCTSTEYYTQLLYGKPSLRQIRVL